MLQAPRALGGDRAARCRALSPTFGTVVRVAPDRMSASVLIDVADDHTVFAPISGQVEDVRAHEGVFYERVFRSFVRRTGRVTVVLRGIRAGERVAFWLEVGEGYVTDRVRLDIDVGSRVTAGQPIGTIVLGSMSGLVLLGGKEDGAEIAVEEGDDVRGGFDCLARARA